MTRSRTDRRARPVGRARYAALFAVLATLAIVGIVALVSLRTDQSRALVAAPITGEALKSASETSATLDATTTTIAATVEIPALTGLSVDEARLILEAIGLTLDVRDDRSTQGDGTGAITMQEPLPGELASAGSAVLVRVPRGSVTTTSTAMPGLVVCIDPGHQSRSNLSPEPIGPGAQETKERIRGGTTGVSTRMPEFELALQISMNLKKRLEDQGIVVVMTRTTNDVDISNAERAQVANEAGASLFIRIHADGSTDSQVSGISTLYPAPNRWTSPFAEESKQAAMLVQDATVASTGAISRGIVARGDITGFNWSQVPVILVECGFMSNPVEDKLLVSPHYQDKLAEGIARGILSYAGAK